MKFGIFVWLVLALLAAGVAARTHSRASHSAILSPTDPAFLRLDKKIRETNPSIEFDYAYVIDRASTKFPTIWEVRYQTKHAGVVTFYVYERTEGAYSITRK